MGSTQNWQPEAPFYCQGSVILQYTLRCLRFSCSLKNSWLIISAVDYINAILLFMTYFHPYYIQERPVKSIVIKNIIVIVIIIYYCYRIIVISCPHYLGNGKLPVKESRDANLCCWFWRLSIFHFPLSPNVNSTNTPTPGRRNKSSKQDCHVALYCSLAFIKKNWKKITNFEEEARLNRQHIVTGYALFFVDGRNYRNSLVTSFVQFLHYRMYHSN